MVLGPSHRTPVASLAYPGFGLYLHGNLLSLVFKRLGFPRLRYTIQRHGSILEMLFQLPLCHTLL